MMAISDPADLAARASEVAAKVATIRSWLDATGTAAVVLARPGSLAWIGAGLTDPIERGAAFELSWAVITASRVVIVTTNVEAPRLAAEESVDDLGFELLAAPWHDEVARLALVAGIAGVGASAIAADGHPAFGIDAEAALVGLRLTLGATEVGRLRALARDATLALEGGMQSWTPGQPDVELQAAIAACLEGLGIVPACLIVGGDDRLSDFRHPLAVGAPIRRLAMGVVVGQRHGLHVALTRFVGVAEAAEEARAGEGRVRAIEALILDACRPGETYGSVMNACAAGYAEVGAPGAWHEHYQGGPVGYRQREFEIAPGDIESPWSRRPIAAGDAVAYNPSLADGSKIEDTFLVTDDGPELLTTSDDWPTIPSTLPSGRVIPRPTILQISR